MFCSWIAKTITIVERANRYGYSHGTIKLYSILNIAGSYAIIMKF